MNFTTQLHVYTAVQIAWLLGSFYWLLKRRDETPMIISGVGLYVFSFRFWTVINGWTEPVDITPFGFYPMTSEDALDAQMTAVLGETCLLTAYMCAQDRQIFRGAISVPPGLLRWLQLRVFLFAAVAIPAAVLARSLTQGQLDQGKNMAFEVSAYLYELPFVLISVAILLALLWKCGGLPRPAERFAAGGIIAVVAYLTFAPTGRFQFLGWLIAVTNIATLGDSAPRRVMKLALGSAIAVSLFAVAGAMRNHSSDDADLKEAAWERFAFAEDANMLDGLVILRKVYPALLPYEYGGGHLEILERPIPRAWWPGKPVGGYMNKLGITDVSTGFTLGISPGLVGSFYSEGGLTAVTILSILYGWGLGRLIRFSDVVTPLGGALLRAVCCASLLPLLRGGDLPGIYAWVLMSFWPCFGVMWLRRRELFVRRRLASDRRSYGRSPGSIQPARLRTL